MDRHIDEAKGRAKEAAGALAGDDDLKHEGKVDQAAADIKDALHAAKDKLEDAVDKAKNKLHHG